MRLACGPGSRRRGARPEVTNELRQAAEQLRAEQRAAAVRRSAARRQEQEVRRKAREQAAAEREQARRARAALGEITSRRRRARSTYEAWLDERDARLTLTRADLHSWKRRDRCPCRRRRWRDAGSDRCH